MSLGHLKCKDNNAAYVKRIMPGAFGEHAYQQAIYRISCSAFTGKNSQKELDTGLKESIIIFTDITETLRAANGRSGPQDPHPPAARNAQQASQGGTRRTVSAGRFLRFSRSGPGQIL